MAEWSQIPEELNLTFVQGDEVKILLDFDQNLTGYTLETKIIEVLEVSGGDVTDFQNGPAFVQEVVSLANGQINLSLQESVTSSLSLVGNYRWFMRWTSPGLVTRTVLSGSISVRSP